MSEKELIHYALRVSKKASSIIQRAYDAHDHEFDLQAGVALSATCLHAEALIQELTAILLSIKSN